MVDATSLIGEVLGEPSRMGFDPATKNYTCPFTGERCIKARGKTPMPVCSVWRGGRLIIICPNRFRQRSLVDDILKHCWTAAKPHDLRVAPEVQMQGFGNVDFVVADLKDGKIDNFLSVEAQAVDVTNSYRPAYNALLANELMKKAPTFNLNWDNVYKRYMTQVIRKGFYHHHWDTKIVALMQDELYVRLSKFPFLTTDKLADPSVNVIFLLYRYDTTTNPYGLYFDKTVGTSHANLSQAALYAKAPSREAFEARILRRLSAVSGAHDLEDELPDLGDDDLDQIV